MARTDPLARFTTQLRTWWADLAPDRRKMVIGAGSVALVAMLASGAMAQRTDWAPLLDGRAYDEVLDAAAALQEKGITYRIEAPGTLYVPATSLGEARAAVTGSANLPSVEDAARLPLGVTPTAQTWALQRAREGELGAAIALIDGIASARVQIVQKPEALFTEEDEPARASVFVRMRPGAHLEAEAVRAIANLVSSSVGGLPPERVAIVDHHGNLLASGLGQDDPGATLLGRQKALERRVEERVARALSDVLGFDGGFSVTAAVELDPTSREIVSRKVDPDATVLTTETSEESRSTAPGSPAGVPGVDANVPERPAAGSSAGTERSSTTASYTPSVTDSTERREAGSLLRMSVAVQVNDARVADLAKASGLDADTLRQRIESAVKVAMGFDGARGDQVGVHYVPFAVVEPMAQPNAMVAALGTPTGAASIVLGLSILLSFAMVVRPMMRAATSTPVMPKGATPATTEPGAAQTTPNAPPDPDDDLADRLRGLVDNLERVDGRDLSRLVNREAPAAAQVLRRWSRNG